MKNVYKSAVIILFLLPNVILAKVNYSDLRPYVGINTGVKYINFKNNFGKNLFKKQQTLINAVVGVEIGECLAVEFGLEKTLPSKKNVFLAPGNSYFGEKVANDFAYKTKNTVSFFGTGLDLIYKPNFLLSNNTSFMPLIGIGLKQVVMHVKSDVVATETMEKSLKKGSGNKLVIPKLMVGAQYKFNDIFGVRGLVSWENINATFHPGAQSPKSRAKINNVYNATIGFIINL